METKKIKTRFVVTLLALAGLAIIFLPAYAGDLEPSAPPGPTMKTLDEVEPRIPIHADDLPLTITEPNSYYLAETISLTNPDMNAITIEANDVTIDLAGYSLIGSGSGTGCGVYMKDCVNVEIRNGTVRDFNNGIFSLWLGNAKGHRIINVRAVSNQHFGICVYGYSHLVKDCTAAENGNNGIHAGPGSTVTGNTAYHNGNQGIRANYGSTVTGNTAMFNGNNGIYSGGSSTVTGNTAYFSGGDGIYAERSSTVMGNTAFENTGDGIEIGYECMVTDNTCDYNGYEGDGAGIHATGSGNRIEQNNVTNNDRGIDVDLSVNLIVKNSASDNTTEYDIYSGNKVGTISTDPTTAGPCDNFDF